jgi:NADPH:quinone reductase-like Zn-dependent oxidoreductase
MRAVYCIQYGGVENLKIVEAPTPVIMKNQILVQVRATTVQTADWRIRTLEMPKGMRFMAKLFFGFRKPKQPIFGTEFAGTVVAVGESVTHFKIGDEVVAATGAKYGGHAEFAKVSEKGAVIKKPSSLTVQEAASIPFGGITALDFLKYKAKVKSGDRVIVNGASGSVGVAAIQVAKILGAHVTAVCGSQNVEFVKSLGADRVIDYSKTKFWEENEKYNVIFDIVGDLKTTLLINSLAEKGKLVLIAAGINQMLEAVAKNLFSNHRIICGVANESKEMLTEIIGLAESGKYRAIIDKEFPLEEIAQAHLLVQSRHKRGNVVIRNF